MASFSVLDVVIAAIMVLAATRGMFVGMIREGSSIGAIGAAILAGRFGAEPVGAWLDQATAGEIGGSASLWLGAVLCALVAGIGVGAAGRWLRRGARIVGLGMADRLGGAAVGAAEGVLVASLVILGATWAFGRQHPAVDRSHSVAMFEELREVVESGALPNLPIVSSGPRQPRQRTEDRRDAPSYQDAGR